MSGSRIGAVVLAAGGSSRMGSANKLLADLGGRPVLARVLDLATNPPFADAVMVTGCDQSAVTALAHERGLRTVHNHRWRDGMASSLRAGVAGLIADLDGIVVLLGDVPLVHPSTLARLIDVWRKAPSPAIVRPVWRGRPGHPVLFASAFLPDLLKLQGDEGAQTVLQAHADRVIRVDTDDEGTTLDADTPDALAHLRRRIQTGLPSHRPNSPPRATF